MPMSRFSNSSRVIIWRVVRKIHEDRMNIGDCRAFTSSNCSSQGKLWDFSPVIEEGILKFLDYQINLTVSPIKSDKKLLFSNKAVKNTPNHNIEESKLVPFCHQLRDVDPMSH